MTVNDTQASRRMDAGSGDLARMGQEFGIAHLDDVPASMLDPELVRDVPVEWARSNLLLPVRIEGDACVLTSDPTDIEKREYLSLLTGLQLRPVLAMAESIRQSIEACYVSKDDSPDAFLRGMDAADPGDVPVAGTDDLLQVTRDAPVAQLVNLILLDAVKRSASDIHIEPFQARLRVRYRIDGLLYEQTEPPKHMEQALVARLKVMGHLDIAEKRLPQDGMARVRVGEREIDIRIGTVPVAEGERVVLRLLDRDSALLPLDELGMSDDLMRGVTGLLEAPNGIVVVCGPTGSGKTTTLYAVLSQLDAARRNILTIEDPVEYQLPDIGQIQVKPKIGLTFATGLRHILRQDPDIVLVGEMRDSETAEIGVRASLTGHLVFTTLHTNDAAGAVVRLLDMDVEPFLLASTLRGALAQRLVRRLCPHCAREQACAAADVAELGEPGEALVGRPIKYPVGCEHCLEGYRGRTGLFELLPVTSGIQNLIRRGSQGAGDIRDAAQRAGHGSLLTDGIHKVADGVTSPPDVISVCHAAVT